MSSRAMRASWVVGTTLILLGILFLLAEIFRFDFWRYFWPFIVIGVGALFFAGMVSGGRSAAGLAIPGSIVTMIGLILLFQNITHYWATWSYAWTLIVVAVGIGLAITGRYGRQDGIYRGGLRLITIGLIMFLAFGAFFEVVINISGGRWARIIWAVLLVGLGVLLLFTQGGLLRRPREEQSVPPHEIGPSPWPAVEPGPPSVSPEQPGEPDVSPPPEAPSS